MDKLPAIKLTPEQARHFAVGERAWPYRGWLQTLEGMIEAMYQVSYSRRRTAFFTISIDPKGVGALSKYDTQQNEWVTIEIFAPVDPDKELMWNEEE